MIVFTDFDGTLIHKGGTISQLNLDAIYRLKERNIKIVLATGRNMYSLKRYGLDINLFDYIIFSSGYGIQNVKNSTCMFSNSLYKQDIKKIMEVLETSKLAYQIIMDSENNHYFHTPGKNTNSEIQRRSKSYSGLEVQYKKIANCASQFLVLFKYNTRLIRHIERSLHSYSVIYSYSPYKSPYCWLEVFAHNVNKGSAAAKICSIEKTKKTECMSVGNDFNDLAMLENTGTAFVVDDCHKELKKRFSVVASAQNNGFAEAVKSWLHNEEKFG